MFSKTVKKLKITVFIIVFSFSGALFAQLQPVLQVNDERTERAATSQTTIDGFQDKTDKLSAEYKIVSKQIEGLKVYNAQKRKQIKRQVERMEEIETTMKDASVLQRQIPPLAQRMLEGLEQFVALDTPFYIDERMERLDIVRSSLSNPKITASEQVRQILEAYNIEAEYGRKISSYEDTIVIDGKEMVVNVLVVGRIGMFYQTKDEQQSGVWNNETNDWEEVSGYRTAIRDGIRMAKKLAPTDMLLLPVSKGGA